MATSYELPLRRYGVQLYDAGKFITFFAPAVVGFFFLTKIEENRVVQVVLMVYEDSRADSTATGMERFHIELLFSPGLYPCFLTEKERIYESRLK